MRAFRNSFPPSPPRNCALAFGERGKGGCWEGQDVVASAPDVRHGPPFIDQTVGHTGGAITLAELGALEGG